MLKSTMQKQIVHIKYYSEVQYNMIGKQSLLSCCKSPSILIFLSSKHTIIFQMSQNDLLKLQTVSFNAMNHITRTWACIIQLRSWQNHFLCREKKTPQLYHSPTARKPLIGDRKNPKISKFLSDTEGKVWRKCTKIWTVVHVKVFLNIARLMVPVNMSFCQGIKISRNLKHESFPSEAPFSSNLYHLRSTKTKTNCSRILLMGAGAFSLSCR